MPKPVAHPKLRLVKPPAFIQEEERQHLHLSQPGEPLELQADRAAQTALAAPEPNFSFLDVPVVENELNTETSNETEEEKEEKKRRSRKHHKIMKPDDDGGMTSRKSSSMHTAMPAHLGTDVGAGSPLDKHTRIEMETRFGHDFGHVRVHSGEGASRAAESFGAQAYTVGSDIVFGSGQFDAKSYSGRDLLAHELAHVVQADAGQIPMPSIMRRTAWQDFKIWIGAEEGEYTDEELTEYLKWVTENHQIEKKYDSDNKARAIVRKWAAGDVKFNLTVRQKILLIQEMQDGPTLDDDEQQILSLLENSDDIDLRIMFRPGEINVEDLNSDFNGDEWDQLKDFYERRFEGGMEALKKGTVQPKGGAAKDAPTFPYNWAVLRSHFEEHYTLQETMEYIHRLSSAEKKQAISDMETERAHKSEERNEAKRKFIEAKAGKNKEELKKKTQALKAYVIRVDAALAAIYAEAASEAKGKKKSEILKETTTLTPDQKKAAQAALKPELKPGKSGTVETFKDAKGYEKALRDFLDEDIKLLYKHMVVDKGETEHSSTTLTYPLKRFEEIANVAQQETDPVFEGYVPKRSPKAGPVFTADDKGKTGNIHDLWAKLDAQLKKDEKDKGTFRLDLAKALILYELQSDDQVLNVINLKFLANPKFDKNDNPDNDEAKIQVKLSEEYTDTPDKVKRLNEIDRGWGATANFEKKEINVQIFRPVDEKTKKVDEEKDRFFLWDWFQTLIHEYCHTLVHKDYKDYAVSFGTGSVQYNTLMEGVDSWLDEVAWAAIEPKSKSKELREKVEGPDYAKKPPLAEYPSITRQRYPTFDQAMQLVRVVGPKNVLAAYFFGNTDLIGKIK